MTPLYISRQKIFQKFKRQARCRFWMTSKASEAEFSKSNSDKKQKSVNWKTKRRGKFWKSKNKWNRCEITTCTVVIMTFFKNTASPPSTGHQATQPKDKRPSSWMTVAPIKNGNFRRSSHFVIGRAWPPVYHSAWKIISPVKFTALCRCKFIRLWGRTSTES